MLKGSGSVLCRKEKFALLDLCIQMQCGSESIKAEKRNFPSISLWCRSKETVISMTTEPHIYITTAFLSLLLTCNRQKTNQTKERKEEAEQRKKERSATYENIKEPKTQSKTQRSRTSDGWTEQNKSASQDTEVKPLSAFRFPSRGRNDCQKTENAGNQPTCANIQSLYNK